MICHACTSDLFDIEYTECPVCGIEFDEDIEFDNNSDAKDAKWVQVYSTNTDIEAAMFKANLEGADIPVQVLSQVDTTRMFTLGNLAVAKLFVPEQFAAEAIAIINLIETGDC